MTKKILLIASPLTIAELKNALMTIFAKFVKLLEKKMLIVKYIYWVFVRKTNRKRKENVFIYF